jgi:hypothetical protein
VQVGHVILGDEPMPNEASIDDILSTQMVGGVQHCIERGVEEIRKTGASHVALFFQVGDFSLAKSTKSLELFITKVILGIEKVVYVRAIRRKPPGRSSALSPG